MYSQSISAFTYTREMSSILKLLLVLTVTGRCISHNHNPAEMVLNETRTIFEVPLCTTPLPAIGTNCYTFELYLNDSTISSSQSEDFLLIRNAAIIRPVDNCGVANSTDGGKSLCAETEINFNSEVMCNSNYRSSVLVCRKWWGEKLQELEATTTSIPISNGPPTPRDIEALCVIFPTKPWCDPRVVCGWYPSLPSCVRGSFPAPTTSSDNVWFIVGILKDYSYGEKYICETKSLMRKSYDAFVRLTIRKRMAPKLRKV